ncbi:unnamed protein product [Auanema sp. JU1783]|nr:unnamed protein product [Auanema sp. JU1783]
MSNDGADNHDMMTGTDEIAVDDGDDFSSRLADHLNISFMYYKDMSSDYHNFSIVRVILPRPSSLENICDTIKLAHFIISLSRHEENQNLLKTGAEQSGIPIIQVMSNYSSLHNYLIGKDNLNYNILPNYITIINPNPIFNGVIEDIFPSLDITTATAVLYDDLYDNSYVSWKIPFENLPVPTKFHRMENGDKKIKHQLNSLTNNNGNIIFVAKTENVIKYVESAKEYMEKRVINFITITKDVTPFKCDECVSTFLFWLRPYPNGSLQMIRSLREFLAAKELGTELNYHIQGYDELDVEFAMTIMNSALHYVSAINITSLNQPTFSCSHEEKLNDEQSLALLVTDNLNLTNYYDFGRLVSVQGNVFFKNLQTRIYRIDQIEEDSDVIYNKMVGTWSPLDRLQYLYDSLDINVRLLTIYRVVTIIQPPFVQYSANGGYEGYCIDLFNLIQERLNFTYTIYEVEDGSFGAQDENGNWNGLIGALVSGSADIALAPLSVMAERENDVDFTVPYYDLVGTTILMKKADVEYSLFKFMKVLEWPVWLCIFAAYIFTSLLLWVFDKFSPFSYTNNAERYAHDTEKRVFTLKECLWFCMTSLTPQGGGEAPKNLSGRLVAASWWLFGFIIIASYTANLAAFLTVSRLEQPITSLDDLAKQYKIEYAPIKGSASETYFRRMAEIEEQFYIIWKEMSLNESMSPRERAKLAVWDYPVSDKFTNMWRYMQESKLPENMTMAIDRVLNSPNGFAFIGDATEIKYAALTNCKLQQVGTEFSRKPYAIAVQNGHVLKDNISSSILILLNQRQLEALKEKWWNENPNRLSCPDTADESDGISIQNIGGVFIMILAGILLSMITLLFEYLHYRRRRQLDVNNKQNDTDDSVQSQVTHIPVY